MRRNFFSLVALLLVFMAGFSQKKAAIVQNIWSNELNSYNPNEYFEKIQLLFKEKLQVNEVRATLLSHGDIRANENWLKQIQEQVKAKGSSADSVFYIVLSSDLRLPTINLGKFLFKSPPRSSKLTFVFHVYDGSGAEVWGDTIINRGCLVKTVDEKKGAKAFYADYNNFMSDMNCHLEVIRKILQEKAIDRRRVMTI